MQTHRFVVSPDTGLTLLCAQSHFAAIYTQVRDGFFADSDVYLITLYQSMQATMSHLHPGHQRNIFFCLLIRTFGAGYDAALFQYWAQLSTGSQSPFLGLSLGYLNLTDAAFQFSLFANLFGSVWGKKYLPLLAPLYQEDVDGLPTQYFQSLVVQLLVYSL
jgi:hypothetical protein